MPSRLSKLAALGPARSTRIGAIGRRFAGLLATVWLVFTLTFAYVRFAPFVGGGLAGEGSPAGASDSLLGQYADWLVWLVTVWDAPAFGTILSHLSYTAVYFLPALVIAVGLATAIRTYTVAREGQTADWVMGAFTAVAVSIPVFLFALAVRELLLVGYMEAFDVVRIYRRAESPVSPHNLRASLWPMVPMGLFLFAVQSRYAGNLLEEYAAADFVKTARMKGASTWRVGRHVLRNNAIPLLSVFFTDMLGMVVVGVVAVEYVVGVPGLGELIVESVVANDTKMVLSLSVLIVLVGVLANFAQDVAYYLFDPRVREE